MIKEFSAGVVPYNKDISSYLVLHYEEGHWDFPKGHVEKGENEKDAALRELKEETGIKNAEILEGFKEKISYFFRAKYMDNKVVFKEVVFFLAFVYETAVTLSYEHIGYKWARYEDALNTITYKNSKEVLKKAEQFIKIYLDKNINKV
jgi:bis(5'-nucleosidyl)-tetraphosphatase